MCQIFLTGQIYGTKTNDRIVEEVSYLAPERVAFRRGPLQAPRKRLFGGDLRLLDTNVRAGLPAANRLYADSSSPITNNGRKTDHLNTH